MGPRDLIVEAVRAIPKGELTRYSTRMGVSMEQLLRLKRGLNSDVKLSTLEKLAEGFGVTPAALISSPDETKPAAPASNTSTEAAPSPPSRASRLDSAGAPAPAAHDQAVGGPEEDPVEVDRRMMANAIDKLEQVATAVSTLDEHTRSMHATLLLYMKNTHGEPCENENEKEWNGADRRVGLRDRRHEEERPRPQLEAPGRIERDG